MQKNLNLKPLLRFMDHLPASKDLELTLLKVHLLVEELLDEILIKESRNPAYLAKARLTYSQKAKLARALSDLEGSTWLWGAVDRLNDARNALGHGLNPEKIQQKTAEFIEIVKPQMSQPIPVSAAFSELHWASFYLYTAISRYALYDATSQPRQTLIFN